MTSSRLVEIHVQGIVQGVGFRPFVYRAALERGLSGWVRNGPDGVRIELRGERGSVDLFLDDLRHRHPAQAVISRCDVRELVPESRPPRNDFAILESLAGDAGRPSIPADLALCADCRSELETPGERRYRYPFTNCTQCGPRYSLIESLPYDRPRTGMKDFPLCADCDREYSDPLDRRFHAQPIACPACGPGLELQDAAGCRLAVAGDALDQAATALRGGAIVALRGLGGFQLLTDALSAPAVDRLRTRKKREAKPFAVMFPSRAALEEHCDIGPTEAAALMGVESPILLVRMRPDTSLAGNVAPGNPRVGAMLPYTPLHVLLLSLVDRPLVCTSGNLSEEPICTDNAEAVARLGGIADCFLVHDRPVVRPVDDSVGRMGPGGFELLRRARGFAPLPLPVRPDGPTILALGAHLKAAIALAIGDEVVLSQHLGDLESAGTVALHERTARELPAFLGATPGAIACDLHPDYASTRLAERLAGEWGVPLLAVQHHDAHGLAVMAEHGISGDTLALCWDGAGLGTDGSVWGGEALVLHGGNFERLASLRPFRLPGGDSAAREPRRSLLGLLFELSGQAGPDAWFDHRGLRGWFEPREAKLLLRMLETGTNSPPCSSVGRLFDAVAALAGLRGKTSFEGQAAMELEFAADETSPLDRDRPDPYPFPLVRSSRGDVSWLADWEPLLRSALHDVAAGAPAGLVGARFHASLADLAAAIAERSGIQQVVLGGGCFQNLRLSVLVRRRLESAGFAVFSARLVPPGDGGIALGQALAARLRLA